MLALVTLYVHYSKLILPLKILLQILFYKCVRFFFKFQINHCVQRNKKLSQSIVLRSIISQFRDRIQWTKLSVIENVAFCKILYITLPKEGWKIPYPQDQSLYILAFLKIKLDRIPQGMSGNHFLRFGTKQENKKRRKKILVFWNKRIYLCTKTFFHSSGHEQENPNFMLVKWDGNEKFERAMKYIFL